MKTQTSLNKRGYFNMMKQLMIMFAVGSVMTSAICAGDFKIALASKKVCEKADGFIQATPGHEGEMADLVAKVNTKRTSVYADIAAREGTAVEAVAALQAKEVKPRNRCK
jgi:uncharacterized protein YdbL (DUF1318 family)